MMMPERVDPTYETLLTEAIRSLAVDSGTVTSPAPVGTNILNDNTKNWAADVHQNRLVKIIRGAGAGQVAVVDRNVAKSLVIKQSWAVALDTTSIYVVLEVDLPTLFDISLTTLSRLQRWHRDGEPSWIHAAEQTAPGAGTALVTKAVTAGKTGYIYGFFISTQEANDFKINWTSGAVARAVRIPFSGKGAVQYIDISPLNEGLGADGATNITITNVNAGSAGIVYQGRLFYVEV